MIRYLRELIPSCIFRRSLRPKLSKIDNHDPDYIRKRLEYYNKLSELTPLSNPAAPLRNLTLPKRLKVYYFDTVEYTRYFQDTLRANFAFGDVTHIPKEPSIVKSRPISGENKNSVLLKLNKIRHFTFVKNDILYKQKTDRLVWRGVVLTKHRADFLAMYLHHPMCDVGKINQNEEHPEWLKNRLTINQHLKFKFILCIEGNDVASNLKWVMSSNSVAVMPKPKYETWFMEGTLIPDYHYILIRDDFSDLVERLTYYLANPEKAEQIVKNANKYVNQFRDKKREDLLSLLVLEKYFVMTDQMNQISNFSKL